MNTKQTLFAGNTSPNKPMTRWKFFGLTLLLVLLGGGIIAVVVIPFIYSFIFASVFTLFLGAGIFEPWIDKVIIFCNLVLIGFLCGLYFVFKKRYEYIFGKNLWIKIILGLFFGASILCIGCEFFLKKQFIFSEWELFVIPGFLLLFLVGLILNPKTTTTSDGFLQVTHLDVKKIFSSFFHSSNTSDVSLLEKFSIILFCKNLQPITKKEFFKNFLELIKKFIPIGLVWFGIIYPILWRLYYVRGDRLYYHILDVIFVSGIAFIIMMLLLFQNYNFARLYHKFYARIEPKIKISFSDIWMILNIFGIISVAITIVLMCLEVGGSGGSILSDWWLGVAIFYWFYGGLFVIAMLSALCIPSRFFDNTK